jgi:myo-inositol-hexaphosphate 3-phosphohydrolase
VYPFKQVATGAMDSVDVTYSIQKLVIAQSVITATTRLDFMHFVLYCINCNTNKLKSIIVTSLHNYVMEETNFVDPTCQQRFLLIGGFDKSMR